MKSLRWMLQVILALSLVSLSGCLNKAYFFDFTREPDFKRADVDWIEHIEDEYEL